MTSFKVSIRWPRTVTTKPKTSWQIQNTSRQNRKPYAKNKNLTKTSRQKQNTSQQNQKPHSKTKDLDIAKTKYLTAKANTHGKTKAILFLLWSIWFCREVFVFAVRFLVLPWCFCFCRDSCGPPYSKGIKFRLGKQVVKKSSEIMISNCLFSVTMSVLLWELHEKFLQFDWIRAVAFQLNLKYLHVKITNLLLVVV